MRAVGLSDLDGAARVLLARPHAEWADVACTLIEDAHVADLWRKRHRTAHPQGGTGSLCAQASLHARAGTPARGASYCEALQVVLTALSEWRARLGHSTS